MFKTIAIGYLAAVAIMSLVTFAVYGWDKRQARTRGWRVPESRLHALAFFGGWPGALIGQSFFRHKTQKLGFKLITWSSVAVHTMAISAFLYFALLA